MLTRQKSDGHSEVRDRGVDKKRVRKEGHVGVHGGSTCLTRETQGGTRPRKECQEVRRSVTGQRVNAGCVVLVIVRPFINCRPKDLIIRVVPVKVRWLHFNDLHFPLLYVSSCGSGS